MRDLTNWDCAQLLNRLLDHSTMDAKRALLRAIDLLSPPRPAQTERALTADDADMVWPDDDGETFFHTIDDAVENEVSNAWPVDVAPPANGELELKVQLAKRIPTATIRVFNITENGHEWEVKTAAQPASGGDRD